MRRSCRLFAAEEADRRSEGHHRQPLEQHERLQRLHVSTKNARHPPPFPRACTLVCTHARMHARTHAHKHTHSITFLHGLPTKIYPFYF